MSERRDTGDAGTAALMLHRAAGQDGGRGHAARWPSSCPGAQRTPMTRQSCGSRARPGATPGRGRRA